MDHAARRRMETRLAAGVDVLDHVTHRHVVHFYGHDDELTDNAGGYLAEALRAGGSAVVVATAEHRESFTGWLSTHGVDVPAAVAGGALVVLDADETMRRFLVGDRPDPELFDTVVGGLVRQVQRTGRAVHVYGEMVALLWDAGQVNAALELESLWNDLGRRCDFALYCAYPTASVADEGHREAFAEVCRLHSAVVGVVGEAEVAESFPATVDAPRAARHFVEAVLRRWGHTTLVHDAALTVTELATNAVVHARSAFTVTLAARARGVTIAVSDASQVAPASGEAPLFECSGRGLGLVAALCTAWGAEPLGDGKVVWAELGG